jgi:hypothetical protein
MVVIRHTVSHVKHRVSLVSTPSKSLCTSVASLGNVPEFEPELVVLAFDAIVITDVDTFHLLKPRNNKYKSI